MNSKGGLVQGSFKPPLHSGLFATNWVIEFMFPRRLHRLAYFLRGMALDAVTGFIYANSTTFQPRYWWPAVIALVIYGLFFIILPRIRDVGMSSWWLLVTLIPVADVVFGIILLFRAPVLLRLPNREGPAPKILAPEAANPSPESTLTRPRGDCDMAPGNH